MYIVLFYGFLDFNGVEEFVWYYGYWVIVVVYFLYVCDDVGVFKGYRYFCRSLVYNYV